MPNFREQIPRSVIAVAIAVIAVAAAACGGDLGGDLGSPCEDHGDCRTDTQCLAGVCTGLCETNGDCGGGYLCTDRGRCEVSGGAAGVGRATNRSVVHNAVAILALDYVVTSLVLGQGLG